jgi:hypothetical protein
LIGLALAFAAHHPFPPALTPDILERMVTVEAATVHRDGIQHEG